jgi:hypothetical protein
MKVFPREFRVQWRKVGIAPEQTAVRKLIDSIPAELVAHQVVLVAADLIVDSLEERC